MVWPPVFPEATRLGALSALLRHSCRRRPWAGACDPRLGGASHPDVPVKSGDISGAGPAGAFSGRQSDPLRDRARAPVESAACHKGLAFGRGKDETPDPLMRAVAH
jgi:hypothetical protein